MKDYLRMFRIKDKHENLPDVIETAWKSPSNIALIKYWGKKPGQLPANPSLSMTLSKAVTYSWVKGRRVEGGKGRGVEGLKGILSINNDAEHPFIP